MLPQIREDSEGTVVLDRLMLLTDALAFLISPHLSRGRDCTVKSGSTTLTQHRTRTELQSFQSVPSHARHGLGSAHNFRQALQLETCTNLQILTSSPSYPPLVSC